MSENFIRKIPAFLEKNENICSLNSHPLVASAVQWSLLFDRANAFQVTKISTTHYFSSAWPLLFSYVTGPAQKCLSIHPLLDNVQEL